MSGRNAPLELPGFYLDPVTGRYFREGTFAPLPKKQKVEKQSEDKSSNVISAKPKHFPHLLFQRETGALNHHGFNSSFFDLKVHDMKWVGPRRATTTWHERYDVPADIALLKGGVSRMYGLWHVKHEGCLYNIIGEIPYIFTRKPDVGSGHFKAENGVVDMCYVCDDTRYILYVTNDTFKCEGQIHVAVQQHDSIHMDYYPTPRHLPYSVWCCNSNEYNKHFAVGGASTMSIIPVELVPFYTVPGGHLDIASVKGNIHAIEWNAIGNSIFCGIHKGKVNMIDFRTRKCTWSSKIYNVGIDEIKVLSDENYLICGTFDGSLCKFDMRMKKKVTEYFGHVHTPKKCPFSVSERMNILAATGSDNVTRIWNLNGGNPLRAIQPPKPDIPHSTWLFCNKSSTTLGCVQGKKFYFTRV